MRLLELGCRRGFTLIEVMVAVMIVSVVIGATISLRGDAGNRLVHIKQNEKSLQYATFLLWSKENGVDASKTNLYRLSEGIDMDDTLRRELKAIAIEIQYKKAHSYDMGDALFEFGTTTLRNKDFQISLERIVLP